MPAEKSGGRVGKQKMIEEGVRVNKEGQRRTRLVVDTVLMG